jgi:hypothetical protein
MALTEAERQYQREYKRKKYPEEREKLQARLRERRARDPQAVLDQARKWRANNPDKVIEYRRREKEKQLADPERLERKRAASRRWHHENSESRKEYKKKHYRENIDTILQKSKDWRKANPEKVRATRLKSDYGLTPEQWDQMLTDQGNSCFLCHATEPGNKSGWHTDHCHTTKKVRRILCYRCNTGLGKFKEDPELLERAAAYIREFREIHGASE